MKRFLQANNLGLKTINKTDSHKNWSLWISWALVALDRGRARVDSLLFSGSSVPLHLLFQFLGTEEWWLLLSCFSGLQDRTPWCHHHPRSLSMIFFWGRTC